MGTEYKFTPLHQLPPNFAQITFDTKQKTLFNLEFDILPRSHDLGPFNYALLPVSYTHLDVYKRQRYSFDAVK